jgi:hypothetical protein
LDAVNTASIERQVDEISTIIERTEQKDNVGSRLPTVINELTTFFDDLTEVKIEKIPESGQTPAYNIISNRIIKVKIDKITYVTFRNNKYAFCAEASSKTRPQPIPIGQYERFKAFVQLVASDTSEDENILDDDIIEGGDTYFVEGEGSGDDDDDNDNDIGDCDGE